MNNIEKLEKIVNYLEDKRPKHPATKYMEVEIPPFTEEVEKKAKNFLIYIGGDNEKKSS
jgi:hypothetical protein